jgi:5-methyltetrahydrofolate--homocysteine methyltransferase
MNIQVRFTDEQWERIERDWTAWWSGELERPLVMIHNLEPKAGDTLPEVHGFTSNYPLSMAADEVIDRYQARLEATRFYGDAWPRWWPNFGPGMMAGFLGAQVNSTPETVWFDPAESTPIERLDPAYDASNVWWQRVLDLTRTAVARWGDRVQVAHTDLGGNLDILASLLTSERLLLELCDAPDEVARLAGRITQLWLRYYRELDDVIQPAGRGTTPWAPIWSPGRCYMLQSDLAYMISPAMFERFVLPDLAACCEMLDHGFYHLDGKGQIAHLDMLLSLERLRGIQWIPGDGQPPPEAWPGLLERIRDGGKLCQLFVSAQGARTIVRELGGRGFALAIAEPMGEEEAEDFLTALTA